MGVTTNALFNFWELGEGPNLWKVLYFMNDPYFSNGYAWSFVCFYERREDSKLSNNPKHTFLVCKCIKRITVLKLYTQMIWLRSLWLTTNWCFFPTPIHYANSKSNSKSKCWVNYTWALSKRLKHSTKLAIVHLSQRKTNVQTTLYSKGLKIICAIQCHFMKCTVFFHYQRK